MKKFTTKTYSNKNSILEIQKEKETFKSKGEFNYRIYLSGSMPSYSMNLDTKTSEKFESELLDVIKRYDKK